jgi:membrane protein insertase Oxa1/YidC/SpoIIIJ
MMSVLHGLFIAPLMELYRTLFTAIPDIAGAAGRIVAFSVLLNLLLLPAYAQMERSSRAGRARHARVAAEVARMGRHFRGRELYYYVRAVHRQFDYRPLSQLLGSADLLVQILMFATVYQFLSGLDALAGAAFGPIDDLSQPDGLLGGINLLPLLMTVINAAAVIAYTQERVRRVQALGLAALFLVLLYDSASGLVLYWTMNNLFSLVRIAMQRRLAGVESPWLRLANDLQRQV